MRFLKKIVLFLSLFFIYLIAKEFLDLYLKLRQLDPIAGYAFLGIVTAFLVYFAVIPIYKILAMPKNPGPVKDREQEQELIGQRMKNFRDNKYLKSINFDFTGCPAGKEGYKQIQEVLNQRAQEVRKKYVSRLFINTSISQNGFIDAMLIFSANINLIKETFILYNGRTSYKDLMTIAKKVYYSVAIGGSEGVEYITNELLTKFGTDITKSIPFAGKILESLADGLVNAVLLTRVALITENYCSKTFINSDKDLYPTRKFIFDTTASITREFKNTILNGLKQGKIEKIKDTAADLNPVKKVFEKLNRRKF